MIGTSLGHYRIVEQLGEGGMGVVYRARDERLNRDVAIKVLPDEVAGDHDRMRRFEIEAMALARLSHPGILDIHDFGKDQDVVYVVTELLAGETLRGVLRDGPVPWRKTVEVGAAIADGLAATHAQGIVHRDLKPENVFITEEGRVKVLDFGLARLDPVRGSDGASEDSIATGTAPGVVLGTVGYMAPEQVRGEPTDDRTDLFALGCVLYEMLAGTSPFSRATPPDTMSAILRDEPNPLSARPDGVPGELVAIVSRCLAKRPPQRFQSAADLAYALRSLGGGEAVVPPLPVARRNLPGWVSLSAASLAVAAAGIGIAAWLSRSPQPSPPPLSADRVAVLPFTVVGDDQEVAAAAAFLGGSVIDLIRENRDVDMVPATAVLSALAGSAVADDPVRTVASAAGSRWVVGGTVTRRGDTAEIRAQVVDGESGGLLMSLGPFEAPVDDPSPAAEAMTQRVAGCVAVAVRWRATYQPTFATPPRWRSYQNYVAAEDLCNAGRLEEAVALFERVASDEPGFLPARQWLLGLLSMFGQMHRAEEHLVAMEAQIAELPSAGRLTVQIARAEFERRWSEELRLRLEFVERFGPSGEQLYDVAKAALAVHRPRQALAAQSKIRASMPRRAMSAPWFHKLTQAHHLLGEHRRELELAREAVALLPDLVDVRRMEVCALGALGDTTGLDQAIDAAEAMTTGAVSDYVTAADLLVEAAVQLGRHGFADRAPAYAERAVAWFASHEPTGGEPWRRPVLHARALQLAGCPAPAMAVLREALVGDPERLELRGALGVALARAGEADEARRVLADLASAEGRFTFGEPTAWRARIVAWLGAREQAVALLKTAFAKGVRMGVWLTDDPDLDPLRGYPPFDELIRPKG